MEEKINSLVTNKLQKYLERSSRRKTLQRPPRLPTAGNRLRKETISRTYKARDFKSF